ncbi:MAG: 3'-5' exonuclease, partial [Elusimicrobiota bacterium]
CGVSPSRILAITFTNKAAQEMQNRILKLVPHSGGMWVCTFHSLGARMIRQHGKLIGLKPDFVIYDEDDQRKLVQISMEELRYGEEKNKAGFYLSIISRAKDDLLDSKSYLIHAHTSNDATRGKIARIYEKYQSKLQEAGAVDFGDLIIKTAELLKEKDDIREYYQEYFQWIFVDEYQDTNHAQYVLIKTLSAKHRNLCVVGDPDQSIYQWRGADMRNILEFEKDFKDAKTIVLEQNYRSTANILHAANEVIKHNRNRKPKNLWTQKHHGSRVEVIESLTEMDEAKRIFEKIKDLSRHHSALYNDMAIFYRTNAQSRSFEEIFRKHRIPYRLIGTVKFYARKEIKDAIAYLKILANPSDTVSILRVINVPGRGVGKTALEKISNYAKKNEVPFGDAILIQEQIPDLTPAARRGLKEFVKLLDDMRIEMSKISLHQILEHVLAKSGYWQFIEEESEKDPEGSFARLGNLGELVNAVKEFEDRLVEEKQIPTLQKYLEEVSLATEIDELEENNKQAVTLMTVHLAKGLEFPVVFLTGLEEGLFPINAANSSDEEMEEERRLCYVGMTRAKECLFLTWANTRKLFGISYMNLASRFILESKVVKETWLPKGEEDVQVISTYPALPPKMTKGKRVVHPIYGPGVVAEHMGSGEFAKVTVLFDKGVKQTFMLKYAPLEVI